MSTQKLEKRITILEKQMKTLKPIIFVNDPDPAHWQLNQFERNEAKKIASELNQPIIEKDILGNIIHE